MDPKDAKLIADNDQLEAEVVEITQTMGTDRIMEMLDGVISQMQPDKDLRSRTTARFALYGYGCAVRIWCERVRSEEADARQGDSDD